MKMKSLKPFSSSSTRLRDKVKATYLDGQRRLPPWIVPLLLILLILLAVLWILPRLLADPSDTDPVVSEELTTVESKEAESFRLGQKLMVKVGECPLYEQATRQALRLSSALYGEVGEVLEVKPPYYRLRLADGYTAWVEGENLTADLETLAADNYRYQVLVLNPYKRVMSHSMDGYMIMRAPMGSLLYADHEVSDILSLCLAEGQHGWMSKSGTELLEPGARIPVPERAAELFVSTALNFKFSPYVPGGMGKEGVDMAGVIYIASRINGLELPRDLQGQSQKGEEVDTVIDVDTGLIRSELLATGDVLFFHSAEDPQRITQAAIILEEGQSLTRLNNDSILSIRDLERAEDLLARLVTVRRFFP